MEQYFSAYLVCIGALLHLWNCSKSQFTFIQKLPFHRLGLMRSVAVHDFLRFEWAMALKGKSY